MAPQVTAPAHRYGAAAAPALRYLLRRKRLSGHWLPAQIRSILPAVSTAAATATAALSATATAAATVSAATTASAAKPGLTRLGFVDADVAAFELGLVQELDR
ncbi:MAG TPA: hypothetical protein VNF29_09220, partial [Candidatus Binataceae bacterium]|nr:hypothetical protein [Candidatus Binataceae bacterium]